MKRLKPVNKILTLLLILSSVIYFIFIFRTESKFVSDKVNIPKLTYEQKMEELDKRWEYEFNMLKDPATGKIPNRIKEREFEFVKHLPVKPEGDLMNTYSVMGPTNLGGRTRAFAFDKDDPSIMLSGGVSSGLFRTTNTGANWTNVTPSGEIHNVTALTQDPRVGFRDIWYYGTGEALGNSASLVAFYLGHGVYKSTDNGVTWSKLAATSSTLESFSSPFDIVHRLTVDPTTGYIYCACQRVIEQSTDGGSTWSIVLGTFGGSTSTGLTDIVCTSAGRLYASFSGNEGTGFDGVWTSTTGASGSWTKIAGSGSASTPAGWNAAGSYRRVVLAIAPSNEDILYVLYYNLVSSSCSGTPAVEADFFKWNETTDTWVDRTAFLPDEAGCSDGNDPFAVQGGYDLVVSVKPDDSNFVVIGGTNAYRSTDGFASTAATTRIGGYAGTGGYTLYSGHHPDVHTLVFHPDSSEVLVSGTDGGIHKTTDITASTVVWSNLNNEYVTYQYYHVAITPVTGVVGAIGGSQDNGTTYTLGSTSHTSIFGGDGVSVGISSGNVYHYVGFQSGFIYRRLSTDAYGFGTLIKPIGSGSGLFVTKFHLDQDNTEFLYYANGSSLYRTTSASTVTTASWTLMTGISSAISPADIFSFAATRGSYTGASKLYLGTTGVGKVFRVDDPAMVPAGFVPVDISTGLPGTGTVSGMAVDPLDDKKLLIVLSSYGIPSIWYTDDASVTFPVWSSVEGNISLPSIRSCAIVNRLSLPTEYYAGTSVGLFSTDVLVGAGTTWSLEGSTSIKYAIVSGLAYRPMDNGLLVGTHGNGMYWTYVPDPMPVEISAFNALVNKREVILNWITENETNNAGFGVERRSSPANPQPEESKSWQKIGYVTGNGTVNEPKNYTYTDKDLRSGKYFYRLKQIDYNGNFEYHNLQNEVNIGIPAAFEVSQNYPNPSNPNSKINFGIPVSGHVVLNIYDITGREVKTLVNGFTEAGYYTVDFDGSNLATGVYFYRLVSAGEAVTKKMILVK